MSLDSKSMRYHMAFSRIERLLTDVIICVLVIETRRKVMNRKVIFFDIDGTLSTETDFTVPESTKKSNQTSSG